jgi:hypothetical protein
MRESTASIADDGSGMGRGSERDESALSETQIQRWMDDGGALPPVIRERGTVPRMWTPSALHARLAAERALDALPRHPRGVFAEGRSAIARIVVQVEHRNLPQEIAADRLRELTSRLVTAAHGGWRGDGSEPRIPSRRRTY